jgi:hypothetical protein
MDDIFEAHVFYSCLSALMQPAYLLTDYFATNNSKQLFGNDSKQENIISCKSLVLHISV